MKNGKKNNQTLGSFEGYNPLLLLEALKFLEDSGAVYLIVGGIATNLHGYSVATKDIDLLIPKNLENTQKILKALENLTCGIAREIDATEVIAKPFTIIGDLPRVDLLLRAGKITFEDAYKNRIERKIDGVTFPYVNLADLIKSKDTNRPKDQLTIVELKKLKK